MSNYYRRLTHANFNSLTPHNSQQSTNRTIRPIVNILSCSSEWNGRVRTSEEAALHARTQTHQNRSHIEMKLKQISFEIILKLFCFRVASMCAQFKNIEERADDITTEWCNAMMRRKHGNRTIRRQTNSRSVKSRTSQLAETFYLKFAVNNCCKCDLLLSNPLNTFYSR